ncbi:sugar ABC transporter ATP-binding protein [Christensenella timonensis]|uniref:sugar ABC transporter ATP-binding protein n=1 Tax=Christensenella timonensis TaxID=1816678 RepID=UPI000833A75C|nr:sugar ABC transporter ATP-binding protein [Christensenella timonensis]
MTEKYILEMKNISKSFFGVQVLENVNLQVRPGEVHVLLGENGAGKSTLIKILSSAYRKESGTILLDGKELVANDPKEALEQGIGVIYQEFNLNPFVSIYENIYLGKEFTKGVVIDTAKAIKDAQKYMDMIGLDVSPKMLVGDLSVAQKQMVEIAKAISANVKVLVLDEPTAAITDTETERLFEIVNNLKKKGIGIIYISHRMQELFEIGDRCTVMRDGQAIKTLTLSETNVDDLTTMMVGRHVEFTKVDNPYVDNRYDALRVENLCYKDFLQDINFTLKKGQILGFAGLVGSGRTEVAKCIMGACKKDAGKITVQNGTRELKAGNIKDAIEQGVVYLSEDRKDEGLVLMHSVADNIGLPNLNKFGKRLVNKKSLIHFAKDYIRKLRIKTYSHEQECKNLSGGNQQKVVIAKWLGRDADVYIFDEPTRGIDVGARSEIYDIMLQIVKAGASIIMISSDLVEVMKMCDKIVIMREGKIGGILENNELLTQKDIMDCALTEDK